MSRNKPTGPQKRSVQKKMDWKTVEIVHPDAAGIDVGGREHWVAVSSDRDPEPVRRFGCFTADLREMGQWLLRHHAGLEALSSSMAERGATPDSQGTTTIRSGNVRSFRIAK